MPAADRQQLRHWTDAALEREVGNPFEEVLRWRAPAQYAGRFCVADWARHGTTIPAGSPMPILTGAANRDPRAYDDPDRFDIGRVGPATISFGHGVHFCIGAHLARWRDAPPSPSSTAAGPASAW